MKICDQVILGHRMMIAAGHPPFAPLKKTSMKDVDPWMHFRAPPLILRRELIENWNFTSVKMPVDLIDSEGDSEHDKIYKQISELDTLSKMPGQ